MAKKQIWQNHHVVYGSKEHRTKDVVRKIRKGVHRAICMIQRFNYLTEEEADTIITEVMLKKKYNEA